MSHKHSKRKLYSQSERSLAAEKPHNFTWVHYLCGLQFSHLQNVEAEWGDLLSSLQHTKSGHLKEYVVIRSARMASGCSFRNMGAAQKFIILYFCIKRGVNFALFLFFHFFKNFILFLNFIVLVLPNIEMNLPQVYMCSPSWIHRH